MAHRLIAQIVFTGGRVLGRAFFEAYKQAAASQKYATQGARTAPGATRTGASAGLTLDEACKILNVAAPKNQAEMAPVMERFKRLFDANEPKDGGSFYLQSKILRARERIEMELREAESKVEAEADKTWNPKVYKDR